MAPSSLAFRINKLRLSLRRRRRDSASNVSPGPPPSSSRDVSANQEEEVDDDDGGEGAERSSLPSEQRASSVQVQQRGGGGGGSSSSSPCPRLPGHGNALLVWGRKKSQLNQSRLSKKQRSKLKPSRDGKGKQKQAAILSSSSSSSSPVTTTTTSPTPTTLEPPSVGGVMQEVQAQRGHALERPDRPRPKSALGLPLGIVGLHVGAGAAAEDAQDSTKTAVAATTGTGTARGARGGTGTSGPKPAAAAPVLRRRNTAPSSRYTPSQELPPATTLPSAAAADVQTLLRRQRLLQQAQPPNHHLALLSSTSSSLARDTVSDSSSGILNSPSPALQSIYENIALDSSARRPRPASWNNVAATPPPTRPATATAAAAAAAATTTTTANVAASSPPCVLPSHDRSLANTSVSHTAASLSATQLRPSVAPRRRSGSGSRSPSANAAIDPAALSQAPIQSSNAYLVPDAGYEHSASASLAMTGARKIWVRRPGASPTLITISDEDLVDDIRDIILRKYANSLGKTFDAPDLHLRLRLRDQKDRLLQPDEHVCRTLDTFYPDGQTVDDAIIIDIPRRTPKASPHPQQQQYSHHYAQQPMMMPHTAAAAYYTDDGRPLESGEGYFPPVGALPSPHMQLAMPTCDRHGNTPHSIAVLGTGHLPKIPSPGGVRPRVHREGSGRPRLTRTHTSSSAKNGSHGTQQLRPRQAHSRTHSSSSDHAAAGMPPTSAMPVSMGSMPKPTPAHDHHHHHMHASAHVGTPPPPPPVAGGRVMEGRSSSARPKRRQRNAETAGNDGGMVASVPPISVLIVEDNPINLKLLEAFVKRLKVRWQTATNGRDAVTKWRLGGFHLVLMDIQLPVMNGLEATREIRRLERVNSIGVFSSVPSTPQEELALELKDKDRLEGLHLFKGPVIIVALTASSLQSDRHEALAAGCNDFLTKALIDFDGWRAWKDFALTEEEGGQMGRQR